MRPLCHRVKKNSETIPSRLIYVDVDVKIDVIRYGKPATISAMRRTCTIVINYKYRILDRTWRDITVIHTDYNFKCISLQKCTQYNNEMNTCLKNTSKSIIASFNCHYNNAKLVLIFLNYPIAPCVTNYTTFSGKNF